MNIVITAKFTKTMTKAIGVVRWTVETTASKTGASNAELPNMMKE